MHVQVVTFGLNGITDRQYREACAAEAPTFARLRGLRAKVWLRDPATKTYGGLYLWEERDAFERYVKGDVFKAIGSDPALCGVRSVDFGVIADLTHATQPGLEVLRAAGA